MSKEENKKSLEEALAQIDKDYGAGSVWSHNHNSPLEMDVIPTGCLNLDLALGVLGWPKGRIIEIYGPESAGKSTLALHAIHEAQKLDLETLYVDAENAFDPVYAEAIGIDVERMLISQPESGEQALNIARDLIKSGHIGMVVIDSVSALVPRSELEGEIGDASVGAQPRMMSQALRMLAHDVKKTDCVLIFINQIREKIGVMFGSPETTSGGRALRFYSSIRCDIRRIETLKDSGQAVANGTRVKVIKNKVAAPHTEAEFEIEYGHGINREADILDLSVQLGLIKKAGAWYSYDDVQIGQGKAKTVEFLRDNSELCEGLYDKVVEGINC